MEEKKAACKHLTIMFGGRLAGRATARKLLKDFERAVRADERAQSLLDRCGCRECVAKAAAIREGK